MSQIARSFLSTQNYNKPPNSFAAAVNRVKEFALQEIQKQAEQKQLYYHNCAHALAVQRRAELIFNAIAPCWQDAKKLQHGHLSIADLNRLKHLIDIAAIAHDLVQEFLPQIHSYTPRKRESGVSEQATISRVINCLQGINQEFKHYQASASQIFTDDDIEIIREAIEATICAYDTSDNSIYQPSLYDRDQPISLPARIVALADIGSLGIDGIAVYKHEGTLIFLEENPDIIPLVMSLVNSPLEVNGNRKSQNYQELQENVRIRLLKRARFQVAFAKGREARFMREVEGLPDEIISILKRDVLKYLHQETIREIEKLTPTGDDATLEQLLDFFEFETVIRY